MLGGCEVKTEEEARLYSQMPHIMRPVRVGEFLKEPPCVPPDYLEKKCRQEWGQECPRTALDPENIPALDVLSLQVNPRTRPLGARFLRTLELSPEDEGLLIHRVAYALNDPTLNEAAGPDPEIVTEALEG
jgi:hypothetical protein